jgi:ABC-type amino acid transport substrate-binding protein
MSHISKRLTALGALLVSAVLVLSLFGLSACGGSSTSSNGSGGATPSATSSQASKYTILSQPLKDEHYGVGFKLGDTDLRDAVEVTLVAMYKDGTVAKIAKPYAKQGIDMDKWTLKDTTDVMPADKGGITTLTVGFDDTFAPYGYQDTKGNYVGFDLDLAREVCKRMDWQFVAKPIDWSAKDLQLNSGNINCIWNGFTIEGRENAYTWTDPYMDNKQVIVVKSDSGITDFAGLVGKHIVTQATSAALTDLQENTTINTGGTVIDQVPDYNTAFMDLEQGSDDAIAIDYPQAIFQISNRSGN